MKQTTSDSTLIFQASIRVGRVRWNGYERVRTLMNGTLGAPLNSYEREKFLWMFVRFRRFCGIPFRPLRLCGGLLQNPSSNLNLKRET
jgi:hypothetical protein